MTVDEIKKELDDLLYVIGLLQLHVDQNYEVHDALGVAYDALKVAMIEDGILAP